jgi:hypothetical protein
VAERGEHAGLATEPFETVVVDQMRMYEFQRDVTL